MKATYQDFFFLSTQIDEERGWVASVATAGSRMGLKHLQSKLSRKNTGFQEKLFPDVMLCLQCVVILETMTFCSLYVVGMNILLEDLFELVNNCVL